MLSRSLSAGLLGIEAQIVEIEVDIIRGLPAFTIVGLPDSTIRESRERIRSAIENSGYEFPPKNFTVNLAPAGFRKQGAAFDLPIAISILRATEQADIPGADVPLVGELSLDGSVKPVRGVISMVLALFQAGHRSVIVPWENRREAAVLEELRVYAVRNIIEAIEALSGRCTPCAPFTGPELDAAHEPGFEDILGQETAKRAMEIAAAGHHNILLYGSPGSGKTMLARRLPTIMPALTREESLETTMIHSAGGELPADLGLVLSRPFRAPHHTSSDVALVGGGRTPSVGEVSLAHNGVLFLDEFIEFRTNVIQALRQPLEDHRVTVSRAAGTCQFPADFMFVAASNPCRCGYFFEEEPACRCSPSQVRGYFHKIAGPVLDRIDIEVLLHRVPCSDLLAKGCAESSGTVRERVLRAREIQRLRYGTGRTRYNARMTVEEIRRHCRLAAGDESLLEEAVRRMTLSARAFYKVLKVSRTIADLEAESGIRTPHLLEALSYKNLQRNYAT